MEKIKIYLGSKNISSWSLRAWLMIKKVGVHFEEVTIELDQPNTKEMISKISPSTKVPVLQHGDITIWDSLSIAEYLAETYPNANLWPNDAKERAIARSISAEMHSGFQALRECLSMNIKGTFLNHRITEQATNDIQRIINIWEKCRHYYASDISQPFLFGSFTIADAMFAPVVTRFISYNVKLPKFAEQYVKTIMELPEMQEWCQSL